VAKLKNYSLGIKQQSLTHVSTFGSVIRNVLSIVNLTDRWNAHFIYLAEDKCPNKSALFSEYVMYIISSFTEKICQFLIVK